MNKRYYEHTLPIIRGSLSNTYDSGRVRKAKSQNDKKRLSQGSLIYIVPKNTTFA